MNQRSFEPKLSEESISSSAVVHAPGIDATGVRIDSITHGKVAELANLDILRSIAVSCVLARHILSVYGDPSDAIFQPQALGIFGVLIFFVHTSLVLMMSINRHELTTAASFWKHYRSFEVRRFFRIYPLSIVVVFLAFFVLIPKGLYLPVGLKLGAPMTWPLLLTNLSLTQNLIGHQSVVGTLWSLPIEVQMYLLLPFLFMIARRTKWKVPLLSLWVFCVLCESLHHKFFVPDVVRYAPCFISGIICFSLLREQVRKIFPWWCLPLGTMLLLLGYMTLYGKFSGEVLLGGPICLVLALLIAKTAEIPNSMAPIKTVARTVAKYSYGIYLFHSPAIYFSFEVLTGIPTVLRFGIATLIVACLSYGCYRLIEEPFIRVGTHIAARLNVPEPVKKNYAFLD